MKDNSKSGVPKHTRHGPISGVTLRMVCYEKLPFRSHREPVFAHTYRGLFIVTLFDILMIHVVVNVKRKW